MIDFSDTPIGDDLLGRIQDLDGEICLAEEELRYLERDRDILQMEYDMLEEMYRDGLDGETDDEEN